MFRYLRLLYVLMLIPIGFSFIVNNDTYYVIVAIAVAWIPPFLSYIFWYMDEGYTIRRPDIEIVDKFIYYKGQLAAHWWNGKLYIVDVWKDVITHRINTKTVEVVIVRPTKYSKDVKAEWI